MMGTIVPDPDLWSGSGFLIWIRSFWTSRIHKYLYGFESSTIKQKIKKTLISTVFLLLYDLLSLKTDLNVPTVPKK